MKTFIPLIIVCTFLKPAIAADKADSFLETHCLGCHNADSKKGGLDFASLGKDFTKREVFDTWVKVFDRTTRGEMPPPNKPRPAKADLDSAMNDLSGRLIAAENDTRRGGRSILRRLTRTEYEFTLRDLLGLPELDVQSLLPEDGRANGYDKSGTALDISHVQLSKYLDAADKALTLATAAWPEREPLFKQRIYPGDEGLIMDRIINGEGVPLKNFKYDDSLFPIPGPKNFVPSGYAVFERLKKEGKIPYRGSIGLMRASSDDSWKPEFARFSPVVPGYYRVRISAWSFLWEKGTVRTANDGIGALYKMNPTGGASSGKVLNYFDAPSLKPTVSKMVVWMDPGESFWVRPSSLVMGTPPTWKTDTYTGEGLAVDWLEIEGPIVDQWPGIGHQRLFGELPLLPFDPKSGLEPPRRGTLGQIRGNAVPEDREALRKLWTVSSKDPARDAEALLIKFLPLAFRRPVPPDEVKVYVTLVMDRLRQKVTFEDAMKRAYKAALCSPDFLYLREPAGQLDDYAIASRLSYFLWCSLPDEELFKLAAEKKLRDRETLRTQVLRLLADPKATRFINDFTDQWLELRNIDATTPDAKLYPEFRPILRDAMLGESRAFFRELLMNNMPASNIVQSDFAMLNRPMAEHYTHFGIPSVTGWEFRRVSIPANLNRGGFLTQAAILKVTANGTTTSPVKRGAWVMRKIVGQPPEPPPPNVPAVEPDTRGVTTIRELLEKHRADASCAGCHQKMDPPGFALESYDVIGGFRTRYRSLEKGDRVSVGPRGAFLTEFVDGPRVDPSGRLADGKVFADLADLKRMLVTNKREIARNLATQLLMYATGSAPGFADRQQVDNLLGTTADYNPYHIKDLLITIVQSPLFLNK